MEIAKVQSIQEALQAYADAPNEVRTILGLADAYIAADRCAAALYHLHRLEAHDPGDLGVLMKLAACNNRVDDVHEAERYYRKALIVNPNEVLALCELEQILREQARYSEVRELLARVLTILPTIKDSVATSIAMLDLAEGRLVEGFAGYERRFAGFKHMGDQYSTPIFSRWDGKKRLTGRSVLMRYEQGLGDTVQFVRYAASLKKRGAKFVGVLCKNPVLHRLIARTPGVDQIFSVVPPGTKYDYEVMMMSMPSLLGTQTEADIPGDAYLSVADEDAVTWAKQFPEAKGKRVGLVWAGENKGAEWSKERMNTRRSIPLKHLRPLFDVDCDFFSLQKNEHEKDLLEFMARRPIHNFMGEVKDFYDTACIIANLDLIITVDTSTAHVAAAMGKPVWMLSRIDGDWRWLKNRSDSPWYPSMTIFHQDKFLDWRPTIKRVAANLLKNA